MRNQTIILALLIYIGMGSAGTYTLGSYNLSTNQDIPANYTIEPPIYDQMADAWSYALNITPNSGGHVLIVLTEFKAPVSNLTLTLYKNAGKDIDSLGLSDVKYSLKKYISNHIEYDALEIAYPSQRTANADGSVKIWQENRFLTYQPDELSRATIQAFSTGEWFFRRVLDTMTITREAVNPAIEIEPKNATLWSKKGYVLDDLGKYEEALQAYDKALMLDPDDASIWINKGITLKKIGKYDEAIKAYDKALGLNPKLAMAWNYKGNVFYALDKYEEAVRAYDEALEIDPQYADAWYNKGLALRMLDRVSESEAALAQAKELGAE
jgi:tetratricopeptide (TPR) repeat protein